MDGLMDGWWMDGLIDCQIKSAVLGLDNSSCYSLLRERDALLVFYYR